MQVAILAAGLGTRLRPLTHTTPKALVPILNRPLLGVWLDQIRAAGASRVAVNTHYLAQQVWDFLEAYRTPDLEIIIRHEPEILGTGGGLRSLAEALGEAPFLAVNADILTDLDLADIFRRHNHEALSTLVLHDWPEYNNVWLDKQGWVAAVGAPPPHPAGPPLAYTGVQVVGRRLLEFLPPTGPADLVTAWGAALAKGERLAATVVAGHFWQDMGTPAAYLAAHRRLLAGASPGLNRYFPEVADPLLGEGTQLEEGVVCAGNVCLGREVRVGRGTRLQNVVAWDRAQIGPGLVVENCLLGRGARLTASAQETVIG
ncbi:MAG: sugar phosphate nucleotidyltransferase [Desulfobaccales bacterium]